MRDKNNTVYNVNYKHGSNTIPIKQSNKIFYISNFTTTEIVIKFFY